MENHIYILDTHWLESSTVFDKWYKIMPTERRQKIDSFYFSKDKRLSLGVGILLHKGFLHEGITNTELSYGENGKPFLANKQDVYFNLSHSENMVICAFSDMPVGVDIEAYRHFDDELANFVYHKSELEHIHNNSDDADAGFTRLWTIKESVMKYFGTGLSLEPKEICIDMQNGISAFCKKYNCRNIYFTEYNSGEYYMTVCSEYKFFSNRLEWIIP